jgi:hypothetical protein
MVNVDKEDWWALLLTSFKVDTSSCICRDRSKHPRRQPDSPPPVLKVPRTEQSKRPNVAAAESPPFQLRTKTVGPTRPTKPELLPIVMAGVARSVTPDAPAGKERFAIALPASTAAGQVIVVKTPSGDPVRLTVPEGGLPGQVVEFAAPAIPPRLYARATDKHGRYVLTVPEGSEGGSSVRAMTSDGGQVAITLPAEAQPGVEVSFSATDAVTGSGESTPRLRCVPAVTAPDGSFELVVPGEVALAAGKLTALLPNQSLAIVVLPHGAREGTTLSFRMNDELLAR